MDDFTDELESLDVSEPPYITIKRLIDVFKKYQPEPRNTDSCKPAPGISTKDNENVMSCEEVGNLYNYNSFSFDLLGTRTLSTRKRVRSQLPFFLRL
jgi:hypothetical protein